MLLKDVPCVLRRMLLPFHLFHLARGFSQRAIRRVEVEGDGTVPEIRPHMETTAFLCVRLLDVQTFFTLISEPESSQVCAVRDV